MSGWIKLDKELLGSVRFRRALKAYRQATADGSNALRGVTVGDVTRDETALLGGLVRLWIFADTHIADDNTLAMTRDEVDELVGLAGFAQALPADWLKILDAEHVELPDFLSHNGTSAKTRKQAAARQAAFRHRHKSAPPGDHSNALQTVRNASNDARPDQTRPDQSVRGEPAHAPPASPDPKPAPADVPRGTNQAEAEIWARWQEIRDTYPKPIRADWLSAEKSARNLVEHGQATWSTLLAGVMRYARLCKATNRMVLNPARYFGDSDEPWRNPWDVPKGQGVDPEAAAAWDKILNSGGAYRTDRIQRALNAMGGYSVIQMRTEKTAGEIRKRFLTAYEQAEGEPA